MVLMLSDMMAEASAQDQPLKLWQGEYKKIGTLLLKAKTLSYTCSKVSWSNENSKVGFKFSCLKI